VRGILEGIWQYIKGVVSLIAGLLTGNWQAAWNGAKEAVSGAINTIKAIVGGIYNIGRDLIQGLINGIKAGAGALMDSVKSIGSSIVSGFKSILKIFSPSQILADEVGFHVTGGIAQGMLANMGAITDAVGAVSSGLVFSARSTLSPDVMQQVTAQSSIAAGNTGVGSSDFLSQLTTATTNGVLAALDGAKMTVDGSGVARLVNLTNRANARAR
jgi:phage-related protein